MARVIILALAILSFPAAARADERISGRGHCTTTNADIGDCFDRTDFNFNGIGIPVGRFQAMGNQRVDYCGIGPDVAGRIVLTTENGDQVHVSYLGVRTDINSFFCRLRITGGTGHYAGATGNGTLKIKNYSPSQSYRMELKATVQLP
jgi:hypothetical protein